MLKWLHLKNRSLLSRFLMRVLLPPFLILLLMSVLVFWLYSQNVREQAFNELEQAASTAAIRLEREIAIRRTVLVTSGSELFELKKQHQTRRDKLHTEREKCRRHIRENFMDPEQPGVCMPFIEDLAALPPGSLDYLKVLEESYASQAEDLNDSEAAGIAHRLNAFSDFFPETLALLIVDEEAKVISEALADTEDFSADRETLLEIAARSVEAPVESEIIETDNFRQAVFSYPIEGGAVLAAYHLDHEGFVRPALDSALVDVSTIGIMLVRGQSIVYPAGRAGQELDQGRVNESSFQYRDNGLDHLGYGAPAVGSNWHVVAGSPGALVLAPLRDAQLAAVLLLGGMLVIFLWLGTVYVQRLVDSIMRLVAGAVIFSSNQLNHRIEIGKADKEFVQLAETMNEMAIRIAGAEAEMDRRNKEFIDIATHELKAPMTSIIGSLSIVLEEDNAHQVSGDNKKLIDNAYRATARLRDLVNDLLDVARIEGGRVEFKQQPMDISSVVNDTFETMKISAEEKSIELIYRADTTVPQVTADPTKLQVVITNFVSNAIKYNRPGGKIEVSHRLMEGVLVTDVSDNGLGIPADQQEHIFEKFYRVDGKDRQHIEGTGLGMYTTKQYIEAMGGEVWFESEPGTGTTFSFSMPVV